LGYRNSLDALAEESPSKVSDNKISNKINSESSALIKLDKKNELPAIVTSDIQHLD
jgi:hypothetical protein